MPQMSDSELLALVNEAERDAVIYCGEWMSDNEEYLKAYWREPYGDEAEGQSQVVTSDCADVVESDMPSLVRTFLGSKDIMRFRPLTGSPRDVQEADEKTHYINHIIRQRPGRFKVLHDWMKDALIQKLGVVKFGYEEEEKTELMEWDGLSDTELAVIDIELRQLSEKGVKVEYVGQEQNEDGTNRIEVRKTWTNKDFFIRGIPTEEFLISRNASCVDDAQIVGDTTLVTKGELIAAGYDHQLVRDLPSTDDEENRDNMKAIRFKQEGGDHWRDSISHWSNHRVQVYYLYMNVDYDGDGVPERRYIVKAGNKILENEQHEMVPYALISAVLMPHSAIGRGRVEQTMTYQRVNTVLTRQMLDNAYRVAGGRVVVNDEVTNLDDLLTVRPNGIVRTEGDPMTSVAQLQTPYIGGEILNTLQYMDSLRAQTTGSQLANQGLAADDLHKETATRFEGVRDNAAAKVELIARVFAETGFRKLFEGMAWYVSRYQDDAQEIMVLGKPMSVDPRRWMNIDAVESNVGLAAGDDDQMLQNMGNLLAIHQQLGMAGSPLTDPKKIYNILSSIIGGMGIPNVHDYANDPEIPEQMLMAQNVQLQNLVQQLQAQVASNPLAEAEEVKAQAKLVEAQAQQDLNVAKLLEEQRQFNEKLMAEQNKTIADLEAKYTELELKYQTDVPGARV